MSSVFWSCVFAAIIRLLVIVWYLFRLVCSARVITKRFLYWSWSSLQIDGCSAQFLCYEGFSSKILVTGFACFESRQALVNVGEPTVSLAWSEISFSREYIVTRRKLESRHLTGRNLLKNNFSPTRDVSLACISNLRLLWWLLRTDMATSFAVLSWRSSVII